LVGVKAAEAIDRLRELGLTPVPLPSLVSDVAEAGHVIGLEPTPGSSVRPKAHITLSVGTHPDYDSRADATVVDAPSAPIQPPLTWPQSAPGGFAEPEPDYEPRQFARPIQPAAAPDATSAPAPAPAGVAFGEFPHNAGASRADLHASGAAAETYADVEDFSAEIPTPDQCAEWDRMRDAETAKVHEQHAQPDATTADTFDFEPPLIHAELVDVQRERAAEDDARRAARLRSARRYRRLTFKQKACVAGVLLIVLVLAAAAAGGHKKPGAAGASITPVTTTTPTHTPSSQAKNHKPSSRTTTKKPVAKVTKPVRRVIVVRKRNRTRARTKVVTVTVTTPTSVPTSSASTGQAYTPPATPAHTYTPLATTPATTSSPASTTPPAKSSPKPASTHASADPKSSGTGGGSALKTPNGATPPPQP
ncbi:MAG: PASTA domain-containing protein, partial [Trebonia sp.]